MRTTIELKPEHRAALLELAARRGEKGFSSLIADAIEAYLAGAERRLSKRCCHGWSGVTRQPVTLMVNSSYERGSYSLDSIGRGGQIRTADPLRPRQVRYQAALRPDILLL